MPEIVLHQWEISPFCRKVRKILAHKGLSFRTIEYNGIRARAAQALSPAGKLPVLDYDGERIPDSTRIFDFLEKRHPEPALLPADERERALVRLLEDWADESLYFMEVYLRFMIPAIRPKAIALLCAGRPSWERAIFGRVATRRTLAKLQGQGIGKLSREQVEKMFEEHLDRIESLLQPTGWLVGHRCTLADIAVGSQLSEIRRTSHLAPEIEKRETIRAWLEKLPAG